MSKFYTDVHVHRGKICHSYYSNGKKYFTKDEFCPSLFIKTTKDTPFKDVYGNKVEQIDLGSIKEYNDYKKNYGSAMELLGSIEPKYQFISEEYPNELDYKPSDIRTFLYDIEVINLEDDPNLNGFPLPEEAKVPVIGVAIKDLKTKIMWVLSLVDYDPDKTKLTLDCKEIRFKKCKSESQLLLGFISIIERFRPDILIGWYNKNFDDSYMLHRITKILGPQELKRLSPSGSVYLDFRENKFGKIEPKVQIKGLQILDYIEIYKKFIMTGRESYSLNYISTFELGEEKVDYQDFDNLKEFYQQDPQSATDYNIYDVELIDMIDKKLGLINLVMVIAYMAKINYEDVLSPIRTWDSIVYNYLKAKNIVIPANSRNEHVPYPGAYVKIPKEGIYSWILTFDLASLYPRLIMQHNISTETILDMFEDVNQNEIDERFLREEVPVNRDYIISGSGQYFRKDIKGFFPELMETVFNKRKTVKQEMINLKKEKEKLHTNEHDNKIAALDNKQLALKIVMNSAYGAMASKHFRYFDIRLAKAITMSGQLAIKWAAIRLENHLTEKYKTDGNRWVYGDTDSFFFNFDFLEKKLKEQDPKKIVSLMDKFSQKYIEPFIAESYKDLAVYMNANANEMFMEREKIMEKFLITGKKHYAYLLWDDEGVRYDEPLLKVTGIEVVRSSTPQIIKPYLKDSLKILMVEPEKLQDFVGEVKEKFMKMEPEEIAFPRSVSNVKQYTDKATMFKKKCPIAVRAAIMYNAYIEKNNIEMAPIDDGAKIKFFYTIVPNMLFNSNVFGYINKIPNKDAIVPYIDYSTQFEKVYFDVMKGIAEKVGHPIFAKVQTNLEDLF